MHPFSILFIALSILLSVLAAPLPSDRVLGKRQGSGRGTWYYDGTNESACGTWNNDGETIVALSVQIFNTGMCGKSVWIESNGVQGWGTVGDACEGCGPNDLDMSQALFKQFASLGQGVLSISWGWS